ncbi:MAG: selenium cofactor biosynthesis protein YqeC, partial [Anaerolineales bacterium]
MKLIDAIRPQSDTRLAIVGTGGKSVTLFRLARQISGPVIVSVSTDLGVNQIEHADYHYIVRRREEFTPLRETIKGGISLVTAGEGTGNWMKGLSFAMLEELNEIAHSHNAPLLLMTDYPKRKTLKAPTQQGPLIPDFIESMIVLVDIGVLGEPVISDWANHPDMYSILSGLKIGDAITPQAMINGLVDENGILKNISKGVRKITFLNEVDTPEQAGVARRMVKPLQKAYDVVVIGRTLDEGDEVKAAFVKVAGVILAAGGSTRMGTSKQLLQWAGQTLVRLAAEKALKAGLDPVVVVTGASHREVRKAVEDLEVDIVHNPDWEKGQSTSVKS